MTIKLHYFALYGRAEAERMMLAAQKADWESVEYTQEEWPAIKATMVGGTMPNLEFPDGTKLGQSSAITRYIAKMGGFYPEDAFMALQADSLTETLIEWLGKFAGGNFGTQIEQDAKRKALFDEHLPEFFKLLEQTQMGDGPWLFGN